MQQATNRSFDEYMAELDKLNLEPLRIMVDGLTALSQRAELKDEQLHNPDIDFIASDNVKKLSNVYAQARKMEEGFKKKSEEILKKFPHGSGNLQMKETLNAQSSFLVESLGVLQKNIGETLLHRNRGELSLGKVEQLQLQVRCVELELKNLKNSTWLGRWWRGEPSREQIDKRVRYAQDILKLTENAKGKNLESKDYQDLAKTVAADAKVLLENWKKKDKDWTIQTEDQTQSAKDTQPSIM